MEKTATLAGTKELILELLLKKGCLEEKDLKPIQEAKNKEKLPVEEILLKKRLVNERDIAEAYANYLMVPLFEPSEHEVNVDKELSELLPEKICRDHLLVPVAMRENTMDVAFFTANSLHIVDELQWLTGKIVCPLIAPLSVVEGILGSFYEESSWLGGSGEGGDFEEVEDEDGEEDEGGSEEIVHLDQPPPPQDAMDALFDS